MNMPKVLEAFFEADRREDAHSVVRTFTVDAIVEDEGASYQGILAIRDWWLAAKQKAQHVAEPLEAMVDGNTAFVRAKVSGQFSGSPLTLCYAFTISDDKIASLEIR